MLFWGSVVCPLPYLLLACLAFFNLVLLCWNINLNREGMDRNVYILVFSI